MTSRKISAKRARSVAGPTVTRMHRINGATPGMRMKTPSASSAWRIALARSGPPTSIVRKLVWEGKGVQPQSAARAA